MQSSAISLDERLDRAVELCRNNPTNIQYLYDLVAILCNVQQLDVAESTLLNFLTIHPQDAGIYEWLGRVAFLKKDFTRAVEQLEKSLRLDDNRLLALKILGLSCFQLSDFAGAIAAFRRFLHRQPHDIQVENSMGVALAQSGFAQEGVAILTACVERNPHEISLLTNLADGLSVLGRDDEACDYYRQAIKVDSSCGQAHAGLMSLNRYNAVDHPDLIQASIVLEQGGLSPHDEAGLSFALGKAYDDCRAFDLAFARYWRGNTLRKSMGRAFKSEVYSHYFAQIRAMFSPDFLRNNTLEGSQSERPVFIVGMYRSGTSLVEQIIASHPEVFGAGELLWLSQATSNMTARFNLRQSYPGAVAELTAAMSRQLAVDFEAELARVAGDADYQRISDKMPHNYFYLGLLNILFPNARVIHCRRHPLDACLSIYFQDFTTNLNYTNDLVDLGSYYALYAQLMEYWQANLSIKIHVVNYEDLVSNPEPQTRKIINFLGLEWNESCLLPHRKKRTVNTASHWQVRQQIHTRSKQRWKSYKKHLQPLIESLGDYCPKEI